MDINSIGHREVGLIGLGRIGLRLAARLLDIGCRVVGFDNDAEQRGLCRQIGAEIADSQEELGRLLISPRTILVLVPAGPAVDGVLHDALDYLSPADFFVDMGNSHPTDSLRRWTECREKGIRFLDVGTSGGVTGARNGPCLTVGGDKKDFDSLELFLSNLASPGGCFYAGPPGWGHLVKMVHNGIEYAFLQAIGEGLHLIHAVAQKQEVPIDLAGLCAAWTNRSIISSRLLEDAVEAVKLISQGKWTSTVVGGGQTGSWAANLAKDMGVPVPALEAALAARTASIHETNFAGQVVGAIRNVFGEHPAEKISRS